MFFCELPYNCANIDEQGNVFPCCSAFCSNYSFGNILQTPFEKIWNGEKAQNFRKQFKNNDYKYCKRDICLPHFSGDNSIKDNLNAQRPASVLLGLDRLCNVKCIFCNPENKLPHKNFFDYEKWADDLFKDVQNVNVCCLGEALFSPFAKNLIKYLSSKYPTLKYDILTNGLIFNEKNLLELNIIDKLNQVGISFHSLKERNYNKIVLNSNFKQVMNNVKYAIDLKKHNKINVLEFRFVITVYNYKEMVEFAKFAKKNNAKAIFMNCIQYNMPNEFYNKINIINSNHKEYNKLIKILQNPIFKENFVSINKDLFNLTQNKKFIFEF